MFCRLIKNARMQGAPAYAEAASRRQAKSYVGNGLKPFPTSVRPPTKDEGWRRDE